MFIFYKDEIILNFLKRKEPKNQKQCLVSHLVLAQQEGQKHQHASVMDNPPHIYVAFSEALSIGRVAGDILGNQQGQTGYSCLSNHLCRGTEENGFVIKYNEEPGNGLPHFYLFHSSHQTGRRGYLVK